MPRSSLPFFNPFSRKEADERPRRARQGCFFAPEPESSRFKFEKLPEASKERSDTLKPPVERADMPHKSFEVTIVSNPDEILEHEAARVRWYLDRYDRYRELGYDSVIRFPPGIEPEKGSRITDEEIEAAVRKELPSHRADYQSYASLLRATWNAMAPKVLSVMAKLYGFVPTGTFKLVPTAYGTGGGSLQSGGAIFLKLPRYRPAGRRSEIEAITHELLCHEATADLREGTAIEDSIFAPRQWHKERLMDLLGRTLLVRAGFMRREEVGMDDYAEAQAARVVDPLYYLDSEHPDENSLRYEGRLPDLIGALREK